MDLIPLTTVFFGHCNVHFNILRESSKRKNGINLLTRDKPENSRVPPNDWDN